MKKFFLSFALFSAFGFSANAQTFSCVLQADSVGYGAPGGPEIIIYSDFTNLTTHPVEIELTRLTNNLAPNWQSYFCLDECFPPSTTIDTVSVPGSGVTELSFHFLVSSTPDSSTATMRLIDLNGGAGDVWYKTFKGVTIDGFVSVVALATPEVTVGPSPAAAGTPLQVMASNLGADARLILTDLNGHFVKAMSVAEGVNELATSDLSAGLYLYVVTSGDRSPASGKISIIN